MLFIMYLSQFAIARYLVYCLLLQIIAFVAILSSADEVKEIFSDEDKNEAFSVGEGQQQQLKIKAATNSTGTKEGYIAYCPCMGRFGNQADQFLGALAFAKGLNRTLILPPWVVYPRSKPGDSMRVPFDNWFQVEPLKEYHRVVTMEKFMKEIAPKVWPPGKRIGFCYSFQNGKSCSMKEGNPFGPFWNHFKINFNDYREHTGLLWNPMNDEWNSRFPVAEYPVIALMGAPGSFPCEKQNRWLQKFVKWSAAMNKRADKFIKNVLPEGPFVGIHLRNGIDFKGACEHVKDTNSLFASTQCIEPGSGKKLTYEMCFPSEKEILKKVKKVVKAIKAKSVFVATDDNPLVKKLTKALEKLKASVHYRKDQDEISDPLVDMAILTKADHFIGNCVSSFSAFAKRMRDAEGKPSSFWAYENI
ncbi:GDP-fucose protein O-fucosyltransferase 1-like [Actinia tenebrosa]|uniref:GDP-fucose protein O-fucosyltransferase 1 n=1 Tax=Actinia tenebrosa TaxID=6105 RepID=A0A6P8HQV5_ACTTE|nr:GDP-fucose protein O-fucosyltransferase 1-like [Actinia tenebrosa]